MKVLLALAMILPAQDAKKAAGDAIKKVRESESYRTKFTAKITTPNSDPMVLDGESVWVKPGVLYIHYKASGGDEKRIIRVGTEAFIYNDLVDDWVDPAEVGNAGAGRGVQNSDEVLGVLVQHLDGAAFGSAPGIIDVKMEGPDIEKVMKEQANQGTFVWKESSAGVSLSLNAEGRIASFTCEALLASADPALKGKKVKYEAKVEVVAYNAEKELKFTVTDPKTKKTSDLVVPKDIQAKIDALRKK